MPLPSYLFQNIRVLRISRGMTQRALANAIGLTKWTIMRWETKGAELDLARLMQLAAGLECSVLDLVARPLKLTAIWDNSLFQPHSGPLLSEKEETILTLRGWPGKTPEATHKALSERFGISREEVIQIEQTARRKMAAMLDIRRLSA